MTAKTYVDPLLANFAKGYRAFGHVNEQILPSWPVNKDTGKIADYPGDNIRLVTTIKGSDSETPVVRMREIIGDGWSLQKHALKAFASDEQAENEDKPFDVRRDRAMLVMDQLSTAREFSLATFMADASNFTNTVTLSGTSQWGESADDPVGDVENAILEVSDGVGIPTSMVTMFFQRDAFRKWIQLDEVLNKLFGDSRPNSLSQADKTLQQVAASFGIKNVIVAESFYNTAGPEEATALSQIWSKMAAAIHIGDRNVNRSQLKVRNLGYTFRKRNGIVVDRWRDEDREGWWVRGKDKFDQFICDELAASTILDAVP